MKNFGLFFLATTLVAAILGSIAVAKLSQSVELFTRRHAALLHVVDPSLEDTLQ
jgi:hypothetical protein